MDVFVVFYKSVRRQKDGRKHHFRHRLLAIWNKLGGPYPLDFSRVRRRS